MKNSHLWKYLSLVLSLVTALAMTGCGIESGEITSKVIDAYSETGTCSVTNKVLAITEVEGGDNPRTVLTCCNGTGVLDIRNRQLEMSITQDGQPFPGWKTFTRMYLVDEWLYGKHDILDYEDKDHEVWVKLDLGDESLNRDDRLWKDSNPLGQHIELIETAEEVTLAGEEKYAGLATYILDIKPDWQVLSGWLSRQPPWKGPRYYNLPELAGPVSFRIWVSKKDFLLLKSDIRVEYELVSFDSSKSRVKLNGTYFFEDYDEPLEIELPQEARDAVRGPIS